ncbi:MAG: hypothetical protein QOF44_5652, partial [Streptomyces sp.]|nr:hypothetical protein [Streptomyces sp.]
DAQFPKPRPHAPPRRRDGGAEGGKSEEFLAGGFVDAAAL